MGRVGLKIRRYDPVWDEYVVGSYRRDRKEAENIKTEDDLARKANRVKRGAVFTELFERKLVKYDAQGKVRIDRTKVEREIDYITDTVKSARFEPISEYEKEVNDLARKEGITKKQANNIIAREWAVRADAVLLAAKAGKVKINPYQRGVLNQLAQGRYLDAVYGKDEGGQRQYEKGTYFNQLGFADRRRKAERGFRGETNEARREQQRQEFLDVRVSAQGSKVKAGEFAKSTRAFLDKQPAKVIQSDDYLEPPF